MDPARARSVKPASDAGTGARVRGRAKAKQVERERRARRQRLILRLKVAGVAAAVLLVAWSCVSFYRSKTFAVTRVEVVGVQRLTEADVLALAKVPPDATLLRFPGREVAERVSANTWVADVSVTRDFPDTMRIRVTERVPAALIDDGKDSLWLVDSGSFVIAKRTAEDTGTLMVVRDLPDFEPKAGTTSASEGLRNALVVITGLSEELRARVRLVSAPSVDKTALYTTDKVEIFIGSADDLAKKDLVARQILAEQEGKVVYINVRAPDRPTSRGLIEGQ